MRWTLEGGILAHLTNGVLPETPFWEELQQKECRSVSEFYRKANKFLKLENSKDALHKAQGMSTSKKNDPGEATENNMSKEKRKREEKRVKSLKKHRNEAVENKAPLPKYMNYHSLIASVDHIYVVTDNNLYRQPDTMKGDRSWRDIKKKCVFHKDIGHITKRCMALKNEIKRLIRAGHFKEFLDKPHAATREELPRQRSPERIREVLAIIGAPHIAGESRSARDRYAKKVKTLPQIHVLRTDERPSKNAR